MMKKGSIKINRLNCPSKLFLAPINTGFSFSSNSENDLNKFHYLRSGNGIGISYVGNVSIASNAKTNINTLTMSQTDGEKWKNLSEIISSNGSLAGMQLGCKISTIPAQRIWIHPNKNEYVTAARKELLQIDKAELNKIKNQYVESAVKAWTYGFKVIQIHAAHGYLLSLMLSPSFNMRTDRYGVAEMGLLTDIVKQIRSEIPDIIIDIRLSLIEGIKSIYQEFCDKRKVIEYMMKLPINIISLSNGIYNINKYYIYPPSEVDARIYLRIGRYFALKYPNKMWNIAGNLFNLDLLKMYDLPNLTYSLGRSLIRDPLLIKKYYTGRKNEINYCTYCGNCHYYSQGHTSLNTACTSIVSR
ncbi:hypothetical protein DWW31_16660 [Clostridium sp. AF15-17LB]|nr:hypothetical protein DWW31_16660 [Clostridium sp. AF15-17LB]